MSALFASDKDVPSNIHAISVMLEMSKLSGWLNANAPQNMYCMSVTLDVSKLSGWLNTHAEKNMELMSVTLDVSKLSGWLNAAAFCQVTPRHMEGDTGGWEVRGRVGGGVVVRAACTEERTGHWA